VDKRQLLMSQAERDRLVAPKKAKKKLITQKQAAEEIGVTERQVRRLLRKLRRKGDRAVIHELRGRQWLEWCEWGATPTAGPARPLERRVRPPGGKASRDPAGRLTVAN
jgi:Helix-turn-helix domain